jgi:anaerobic selenocysteine-containing dehydrogenase
LQPDPYLEIHPETAKKLGIQDGQWVVIESPRGKVRQRAKIFEGVDPRVLGAQHAWWYPEKKAAGKGWNESNINVLTDNAYASCDPAMGATSVRTLLCNIYPEPA